MHFTFSIVDQTGQNADLVTSISGVAQAAVAPLQSILGGTATIDVRIDITTVDPNGSGRGGGASVTTVFDSSAGGIDYFQQGATAELLSGTDPNGAAPDVSIYFTPNYLRNVIQFDPTPYDTGADLVAGRTDMVSVILHEVVHALAFNGWRNWSTGVPPSTYMSTFDRNVDAASFTFAGEWTSFLHGAPVPLTSGNIFHYGNASDLGTPLVDDGLMNGVVFYHAKRYSLSALDIAMMLDSGVPIIGALGTPAGDTMTVGNYHRAHGGPGNDTILGTSSAEQIFGDAGNDSLDGGAGSDVLTGGAGDDTYTIDTYLDAIVEASGQGSDTVLSSDSYIMHANVENVTLTGNANNGVQGNDLANVITGNDGSNGIAGGNGNDTINGNDGADVIDGQAGSDSMTGGNGTDTYFVDSLGDAVLEVAQAGEFDTIWTLVSMTLPDNVEIVILNGALAMNATGNDGPSNNTPNLMLGNNAANTLTTLSGDDIILGRNGTDVINSGAGSANGVEIISGGGGSDTLTSGGGHDFFTYENISEAGDTITDFTTTAGNDLDILDLRPMFFPTFTNTAGIVTVAQAVASGHLAFTQVGADTRVFADANGGANDNILLATLNNTTASSVQLLTLI